MADLDKLRALLALLREFGVEKFEEGNYSVVLTSATSPAPKVTRQQPEDPAVATVRKLQELLPGGVDLG